MKKRVVLSKKPAWLILVLLVIFDAVLDVIFEKGRGIEGNILEPLANFLKIKNPILLTPFVLLIFYFAVKAGAPLIKKIDKIQEKTEELMLTALVVVYGVFDFLLILGYFFNVALFRTRLYLTIVLILVGLAYSLWAERKLREK